MMYYAIDPRAKASTAFDVSFDFSLVRATQPSAKD